MSPDADDGLFRTLFETAPDAMIVVDRSGSIVLANPQAGKLFGYGPDELPGMKIEALMPAGVRQAHEGHREAYMTHPRVRPMGAGYELTGVRSNGQSFPVEIGLSPIQSSNGPLFAASIRDISETQRARQALARARNDTYLARLGRLVLEAPNLQAAIERTPGLLAEALETGAVALAFGNPQQGQLEMRSAEGLSDAVLAALPAALAQAHASGDGIEPLALGRAPAEAWPQLRKVLEHDGLADAALVPLLDRYAPMGVLLAASREAAFFDPEKLHFLQLAANMLAATIQRSRSEEQLAHAQRLDALGQLTGGIAHDFNNLLTIVSGNLQLLDAELGDSASLRPVMDSASRAVERCNTLTRKLLGFARRRALVAHPVQPIQVLGDLEDMLGRTLGARILVTVDCPPDVPAVYADPGELDAALVNLALNARDAMPDGGLLRISVRERHVTEAPADDAGPPPGSYVAFTVTDTGTGMSREVLARALEPFFTTKEANKGSGLGLSMVYGFAKQSGGHIRIDSQPGYGTRVELLIPAVQSADDVADAPAAALDMRGQEMVLVVEDEPEVRKIAVAFLRRLGYATCEAGNAESALERLRAEPRVALLFSDVLLGSGQTGFELARAARQLRPGLPALLTSGYEYGANGGDAVDATEFELLRKPYRHEQLAEAVRRTLDRVRR